MYAVPLLQRRNSYLRIMPSNFTLVAAFDKMQSGAKTMSGPSEDFCLGAPGPRDVTLYTRPGCHLCEEAKAAIAPLLREFGASLREVNIDEDPDLKERYGWDVPVIFIGVHKAAKHRVDLAQFRRRLEEARTK
jgi:glutaredoxin